MLSALDTVRNGLRRHGNRARIAHSLVTKEKTKPDGGVVKLDNEGRKESIVDALVLWHELAAGGKWKDPQALEWWKGHIEPELSASHTGELPDIAETGIASRERKDRKEKLRDELKKVAGRLLGSCPKLSAQWRARWKRDDEE